MIIKFHSFPYRQVLGQSQAEFKSKITDDLSQKLGISPGGFIIEWEDEDEKYLSPNTSNDSNLLRAATFLRDHPTWTPGEIAEARDKLASFEEGWNAPGMEKYDENDEKSLTPNDLINLRNQIMSTEEPWPLDKRNINETGTK